MKAYPIDYFMKTGLRAVIHLLVAIMATEALSQDLNCLDVDYKVMAYTYAGSSAYDPTSFGGGVTTPPTNQESLLA